MYFSFGIESTLAFSRRHRRSSSGHLPIVLSTTALRERRPHRHKTSLSLTSFRRDVSGFTAARGTLSFRHAESFTHRHRQTLRPFCAQKAFADYDDAVN
jgi:hypothetical protein